MQKLSRFGMATMAIVTSFVLINSNTAQAATSPTLGVVGSYSVLGHTTVTNTGATTMPGDLGISKGGAPTGFPPGVVGPPGTIRNAGDSLAAQNANTAAFLALSAAPNATCDGVNNYGDVTKDLVGLTLTPGVYCAGAFTLNGTLNLDAEGDPDAVWIFRSDSSLITSTGDSVATVRFVGVGSSCNVWWKVASSATLGTSTDFIGNILAYASITIATGVRLDGRALVQTGEVTLDDDTITGATCLSTSTYGNSDIKVKKTASKYDLKSGPEKVTFTYKVTNEGDVELSDISVKDDKCDDVSFKSGDDNNNNLLDTNEEWKYTCKKTVKKTETNTVTAKGTANGERVKSTDTAKVTVSTPGLPSAGFGGESNFWSAIFQQITSLF